MIPILTNKSLNWRQICYFPNFDHIHVMLKQIVLICAIIYQNMERLLIKMSCLVLEMASRDVTLLSSLTALVCCC